MLRRRIRDKSPREDFGQDCGVCSLCRFIAHQRKLQIPHPPLPRSLAESFNLMYEIFYASD